MYKPYFLLILFIFIACPIFANAENRAVSSFNYSAGIHWSSSDKYDSYGGKMLFNFPISKYFGANLWVSATGDDNSYDTKVYTVEGGVFLRDFDLGFIGASVAHSEGRGNDIPNASIQNYSLSGAWYYKNITSSISVSHADSNDSHVVISNEDNGVASLEFYLNDSISSRVFIGFFDLKENYGLSLKYQPNFLGNKIAIDAGLSNDENEDTRYIVSLIYYFGESKSLIDRDRKDQF